LTAALLWLGILLGLRHALEADHLSAVAALASRPARLRDVVRVAAAWGLGHAAVLLLAGTALAWTGAQWPPTVAATLELAAALVLMWLGVDVLRRASRPLEPSAPTRFAARAFVIGGVHGIEGSGAVVLLALPAIHSVPVAAAYLAAFGVGSVAGMVTCSFALTLPLGMAARHLGGGARVLRWFIGLTSLAIGALLLARYMRSIFT
jgi:hypothetical protein